MTFIQLLITALVVQATVPQEHEPQVFKWVQEEGYFKLYGAYLEEFIKQHPKTLVVVYDSSVLSQKVMKEIENIHDKLEEKGVKLHLAKLFHGDSDRHVILWNIRRFPFLRLYVGEEVYTDLNMYPSSANVYSELVRILESHDDIIEINDERTKTAFLNEPLAFYMRFPAERTDLIYFLEKLQQLDSRVRVYYTHRPEFDAFKNFNPDHHVLGIRQHFDSQIKFLSSPTGFDRNTILSFFHAYKNEDYRVLDEDLLYEVVTKKIRTVAYFNAKNDKKKLLEFKRLGFTFKNSILFVLAQPDQPSTKELKNITRVVDDEHDTAVLINFHEDSYDLYSVSLNSYEEMLEDVNAFNAGIKEVKNQIDEKQAVPEFEDL